MTKATSRPSNGRYIYSDILRCIAAFMVVLIHTTSNVYNEFSSNWNQYLVINSLTSFAVPTFILISGAFLLHKKESIGDVYKKRVSKMVVALGFWSIVYVLFRVYYLNEDVSVAKSIVRSIFDPQYWHLWFMYTITSIYMILPFVRSIYHSFDRNQKAFMLFFFLIVPICLNTFNVLMDKWRETSRIFWYFPELGYFLLGGMIVAKPSSFYKKHRIWIILLLVYSFLLVVFFSHYISVRAGIPKKDFINYDKLFVLLFSTLIFCLLYSFEESFKKMSTRWSSLIRNVANVTLGIYLIHPLVMGIVGDVHIFGIGFTHNAGSSLEMILGAALYFAISLIICLIISRIKYIRNVIM